MSDLLEKEKVDCENEGEGDDDSNRSDSSDGEESQSESNDNKGVEWKTLLYLNKQSCFVLSIRFIDQVESIYSQSLVTES